MILGKLKESVGGCYFILQQLTQFHGGKIKSDEEAEKRWRNNFWNLRETVQKVWKKLMKNTLWKVLIFFFGTERLEIIRKVETGEVFCPLLFSLLTRLWNVNDRLPFFVRKVSISYINASLLRNIILILSNNVWNS